MVILPKFPQIDHVFLSNALYFLQTGKNELAMAETDIDF